MAVMTRRQKTMRAVAARELPQELIHDILSRAHIKDLIRFRCVSKSWLHLLSSDPNFNKLHQINNTNNNPGIIALTNQKPQKLYYAADYTSCDESIKFDLPFHKSSSSNGIYVILGICNGLICLCFYSIPAVVQQHYSKVYVWNPLTGHHITIPCPPLTESGYSLGYKFGFGFHEVSNEYKVIRLVWTKSNVCRRISIYTLGSDSWRNLQEIPYDFNGNCSHRVSLVNGALYWIAKKVESPFSKTIICFDVKAEVFQEIPLPNGVLDDHTVDLRVCAFDGQLSLFCMHDNQKAQVWVMNENGVEESWIKQWEIVHPDAPIYPLSQFEPLGLTSNGKIIMKTARQELSLYNTKNSSITKLKEFEEYMYDVFTYHGRLTSLKSYHGLSERKMHHQMRLLN